MVSVNVLLVVIAVSGVASTWSSSINSMFTSRSIKSAGMTVGTSLIDSVANGAQMAMEHCQETFKWDKWNCPESAFTRRGRQPATKESAFVLAITSAGIVHSITRNCSRGELTGCGCSLRSVDVANVTQNEEETLWNWGGCSDNVEFGERLAENILGELERGIDAQASVNLHNNAVGRLVVRSTMQKRCRCHGVSGSCTVQTCWMQMADFSEIADLLKQKYDSAVQLDFETGKNKIAIGNSVYNMNEKIAESVMSQNPDDLVYLSESPNYCRPNAIYGWNGTLGRSCSRNKNDSVSAAERRSCKNLCRSCGHRVRKEQRVYTKRCNCVFNWCCEVTCDTCKEIVDEYFCE